jgi:hypothetical protein
MSAEQPENPPLAATGDRKTADKGHGAKAAAPRDPSTLVIQGKPGETREQAAAAMITGRAARSSSPESGR